MLPDYIVSSFYGLNTYVKDVKSLKKGYATSSKNWITGKYGDHIELCRGTALLGQTREMGSGKVSGMGVAALYNGTEIPYFSHGQKVMTYSATDDDVHEVGTNILGSAAANDDVWFSPYQNLAGTFMYFGSPNSGTFKSPVANPTYAVSQSVSSFRFGFQHIGPARSYAGQRNGTTAGNNDKTGLYLSAIDKALLSSYTQTTGEAFGTGNGSTTTFTHILTAVSGVKTCMYPSVTDGVETFVDDRNGLMVGSLGGTGTINYATGSVSVTFITAPANLAAITCSYYTEDATSSGPLDFDTSSPGAGKAKIFRQDDGGLFMSVLSFLGVDYAFHKLKTWALTVTLDDTATTNLPYRNIGIPYPRSAAQTPDGILLLDVSNPSDPKVRRLEIAANSINTTLTPSSLSDSLDLSTYGSDYAVVKRFGDLDVVCLQEYTNGTVNSYNSTMFVRNVFSKSWDMLGYNVSCLDEYNGTLIAGDSISNNVYTLFSGFDADGSVIDNYWQDGKLNLGTENLKRVHQMRVTGLIMKDQSVKVSIILDDGTAVDVFTIEGDGSYVDTGINTPIGSVTIGSKIIGGGGEATAHPFDVTFGIHTDKFQYISTRFEAQEIGYAAIHSYTFKDIRDKGTKSLSNKTV